MSNTFVTVFGNLLLTLVDKKYGCSLFVPVSSQCIN